MTGIFGIKGFALKEYAIAANAILGIRDSGKTYTATEASEELFEGGVPFIWLDPIGVAHNLRIPGKGRGYPVVVAGGKHGDLPLSVKSVGEIVRAAMKANISLVLDLFSVELSKADWRRIVRETCEILLHENSEHGLRHVFIEEAAEFVPQRVTDGQVFSAVEKLVRMGGNSKVGITLINQRSADLNKSVLELCANVFVHRQKGKNTLLDLKKWLQLTDPETEKKITASLPDLASGQCWVLSNELKVPVLAKIPAKNSLHPDRRAAPISTMDLQKHKPVPADDFVARMKAALAPKPKTEAAKPASKHVEKINMVDQRTQDRAVAAAIAKAWSDGWGEGHERGFRDGVSATMKIIPSMSGPAYAPRSAPKGPSKAASSPSIAPIPPSKPPLAVAPRKISAGDASGLPAPQRKVLASIGFWHSVGTDEPTRAQVGGVAGYSPSSGGFNNLLGALNTAGLITIPSPGRVALSPNAPFDQLTADEAQDKVLSVLSQPQQKLVAAVAARGGPMSRDDLGADTGYSPGSGGFNNLIGSLCTLTIFEKPAPGTVALSEWAREVLA